MRCALPDRMVLTFVASSAILAACAGGGSNVTQSDGGRGLREHGVAVPASMQAAPSPVAADLPGLAQEVDSKTARAAWIAGVAAFENGDVRQAAEQLKVAAAGRADDPYAHYLLGLARARSGDLDGAAESFERAAALTRPAPRPGSTSLACGWT